MSAKSVELDKDGVFILEGDRLDIAKSIVGYSVIVRKNEQSFSMTSLSLVLTLFVLLGWWFWRIGVRISDGQARTSQRATQIASGDLSIYPDGFERTMTPVSGVPSPVGTLSFAQQYFATFASPAGTIVPATVTPSPVPSSTATLAPDFLMFKLSFYDPAIGRFFPEIASVNCATWDGQQCVSKMANGDTFMQWYGRGVACPPPLQLGDIVRVVYPSQLAGDWTCIDRGGAIVDGYLDFLLRYPDMVWTGYNLNDFPWSSTVQAYHLRP